MINIAISFRSKDSEVAQNVYSRLVTHVDGCRVFWAPQSIYGGHQWANTLDRYFSRADCVVVIVGKSWATENGTSRLGPEDYVRRELEAAYRGRCRIFVPLLVDGASVPGQELLKETGDAIQEVFRHQAIRLESITSGEMDNVCDRIFWSAIGFVSFYPRFPVQRVGEMLSVAENRFFVWHTWAEYFHRNLLGENLKQFLQAVWDRMEQCSCRLLFAHPECDYANSRAREIGRSTLDKLQRQTFGDIEELVDGMDGNVQIDEVVEVRLYTSFPLMPLYIVDDTAFVGWYLPGTNSHYSSYAEVGGMSSKMLRSLESTFMGAWEQTKWEWNFRTQQIEEVSAASRGSTGISAM